ncbi:hypothetical protein V490_05171 [Pseudogymnoascus sp. VKM F-3557]|nr:hypothetical protein V490_05171 [Pseudogymnoascus sp. VKM F-3557]
MVGFKYSNTRPSERNFGLLSDSIIGRHGQGAEGGLAVVARLVSNAVSSPTSAFDLTLSTHINLRHQYQTQLHSKLIFCIPNFVQVVQLYSQPFDTMSVVSLLGVNVLNNPAKFGDSYEFEITFECLEQLQKDLEWKLTYVGSATSCVTPSQLHPSATNVLSDEHDQELDSLLVGPIPVGVNKFIFEADPPDTKRIPDAEILGVTVILLTCAYDGREFVRVGYYVNNEYDSDELNADPPAKPLLDRVRRNVLAEKPRVTRFAIKWDSEESAPAEFPPEQPEADLVADGEEYGAEEVEEEEEEEETAEGSGEANGAAEGEDEAMAGVEGVAPAEEEDDEGSEDLEGESSGSEAEEEEEEEGEGEADDGMEVDEPEKAANGSKVADAIMSH